MDATVITEGDPARNATVLLDYLRSGATRHDQDKWFDLADRHPDQSPYKIEVGPAACGTVLCTAGAAVHLAGWTMSYDGEGTPTARRQGCDDRPVVDLAADLLGLDEALSCLLFLESDNRQALRILEDLAHGVPHETILALGWGQGGGRISSHAWMAERILDLYTDNPGMQTEGWLHTENPEWDGEYVLLAEEDYYGGVRMNPLVAAVHLAGWDVSYADGVLRCYKNGVFRRPADVAQDLLGCSGYLVYRMSMQEKAPVVRQMLSALAVGGDTSRWEPEGGS
jgi:hypothetical protein